MNYIFLTLGYHPELDGGAWRYAAEIAEGLAEREHEVHVICPLDGLDQARDEERNGVWLHWYPRATGNFFKKLHQDNIAAAESVGKVRASMHGPSLLATHHGYLGEAFRDSAGPRVFMYHGPWSWEYRMAKRVAGKIGPMRWFHSRIANWLHHREHRAVSDCDEVFVVSEHFKQRFAEWHGASKRTVSAISGGVDFERFVPNEQRSAVRARYGLKDNDFLFLTLRRLDSRMGLQLLVEAFARVAKEFPNARLWMAGKGPLKETLEAEMRSRGIDSQARLLGFVPEEELPDVLNAADCTVMPSLDLEGFGLATVESLACGTPVLGSDAGATPELIEPLSKELLFSSNDVDALCGALRKTLSGSSPLPAREKCVSYCRERFGWDRPVSAFVQAAERLGV